MTTKTPQISEWDALRTDEGRESRTSVASILRLPMPTATIPQSVRVRIIDSRFRGLTHEERDDLVGPLCRNSIRGRKPIS